MKNYSIPLAFALERLYVAEKHRMRWKPLIPVKQTEPLQVVVGDAWRVFGVAQLVLE